MTVVLPSDEVKRALDDGTAVVALESTIISHGLPRPDNLEFAREFEQRVRDAGATPATIAIVGGVPRIGLEDDALRTIALDESTEKVSVRDLGAVMA
ncbi:MAG: pseudouridine-5-phosphate glycosidase, partial [Candidatus Puniceispirillum sp. TMED52]